MGENFFPSCNGKMIHMNQLGDYFIEGNKDKVCRLWTSLYDFEVGFKTMIQEG